MSIQEINARITLRYTIELHTHTHTHSWAAEPSRNTATKQNMPQGVFCPQLIRAAVATAGQWTQPLSGNCVPRIPTSSVWSASARPRTVGLHRRLWRLYAALTQWLCLSGPDVAITGSVGHRLCRTQAVCRQALSDPGSMNTGSVSHTRTRATG